MRVILHIDLDSFYASCEEKRSPSLRGKPVVVCAYSGRTSESGAVATANYEARKAGIHAGMSIKTAKTKAAKETVFLPSDMEYYRQVSGRIMNIIRQFSPICEQRSIDEAYLDLSDMQYEKAQELARHMKSQIQSQEDLTCSVGIGKNKLIAKMASKEKKPDGLTVIKPEEVESFLFPKPIEKLFGVGPKTVEVLKKYGISTVYDLTLLEKDILVQEFGEKKGILLHERAKGQDNDQVKENPRQQLSKIGTLPQNTQDISLISEKLSLLCAELLKKIEKENVQFSTISLLTINAVLEMKTKSKTFSAVKKEDLFSHASVLLREFIKENPKEMLRRIGIRVSGFQENTKQRVLWEFTSSTSKASLSAEPKTVSSL